MLSIYLYSKTCNMHIQYSIQETVLESTYKLYIPIFQNIQYSIFIFNIQYKKVYYNLPTSFIYTLGSCPIYLIFDLKPNQDSLQLIAFDVLLGRYTAI